MKDYSKLNKQFVLIDIHEDREDYDVAAGVAIPAECADEFARAVEELAVEKLAARRSPSSWTTIWTTPP